MSSSGSKVGRATLADLLAVPEAERYHEIIDGELVRKATPSFRHGRTQFELAALVGAPYSRRAGRGGPGGWHFATEIEIAFSEEQVLRPDVSGWRRQRLPVIPEQFPVTVRPDWVCEILSPSNAENDLFKKIRIYQRAEVGHYWIIDPVAETLAVYRWTPDGFLLAMVARGEERVRAEPFDAVEISVRALVMGDDEAEDEVR